jgi:hypothetical protein
MNQAVSEYIDKLDQKWQSEVCSRVRQIIRQAVPEIEERIQYGKPHFLKDRKYAYVLASAKHWVSFTIFNASALEAPDGFFEPSDSADRRTIKIRQGQAVDYDLLAKLVQQAATS